VARECGTLRYVLRPLRPTLADVKQELRYQSLKDDSTFYPFHGMTDSRSSIKKAFARLDRASLQVDIQSSIWPIGAVMYQLATLDEADVLDDVVEDILAENRQEYEDGGIIDHVTTQQEADREYSDDLRELIRDCLKLRPKDRPTPTELTSRTMRGLQACFDREANLAKVTNGASEARLHVMSAENSINQLREGRYHFDRDDAFWRRFVRDLMWVPGEWGDLMPPSIPANLEAPREWPEQMRAAFKTTLNEARYREHHAPRRLSLIDVFGKPKEGTTLDQQTPETKRRHDQDDNGDAGTPTPKKPRTDQSRTPLPLPRRAIPHPRRD